MKKKKLLKKRKPDNWIIMGLGNPGSDYSKTRHNVGFQVIELLQEQLNLSVKDPFFQSLYWMERQAHGYRSILVKPLTFMNRSGQVLPWLHRKFYLSNERFLVILDNMDLPAGQIRLKIGGSSAGHNGLKSLMKYWGSGEFARLYIGVGKPKNQSVVDHVLGIPEKEEREQINTAVIRCAELVQQLGEKTLEEVRIECNRQRNS